MSRIGKQPVTIPPGVTVTAQKNSVVVKGNKGELTQSIPANLSIAVTDRQVVVSRLDDQATSAASQGLIRTLVSNMIEGVSQGFKKQLEIEGVGFKVNLAGNSLKLSLGYSHEINFPVPNDIQLNVEGNIVTVEGINKQRVGQVAAEIRALRKPEPYKGKGIRYVGEQILRKAGKTAAGGGD